MVVKALVERARVERSHLPRGNLPVKESRLARWTTRNAPGICLHCICEIARVSELDMTTKQKKRVRWAESDDVLGEDAERAHKLLRRSPLDDEAVLGRDFSTTESAGPDPTSSGLARESKHLYFKRLP